MRLLIQRVQHADVVVEGESIASIRKGFLVFIGISDSDTEEIADRMLRKLLNLRLFEDENGKTNLSLEQVDGKVLVVSQFTLYADCRKGTRPSFADAAPPDMAESLYNFFLSQCEVVFGEVQHGEFGADMKVELLNDGPFTIYIDSETK